MDVREQLVLAVKSVFYMFLMPLSGVMCFSFMIAHYHFFFNKELGYGFFTGSLITETGSMLITGYCFYFAVTESFKVRDKLNAIREEQWKRKR